jgi:alpha-beta hydrolase superfamily lysophospholipase
MRCAVVAVFSLVLATAATAAPDPTRPGKLVVGVTTVDAIDTSRGNRTLPTEIWYPARHTGRDTEPLPRSYPLVLIAHGLCGSRLYYDYLAPHLASYGFVVAAPDFTGVTTADCAAGHVTASIDDLPLDLSFVCRELHDVAGPLGTWARHVRGIPTGLIGNSLGGIAVVEAAKIDPSFTTIVGLAPAVNADAAPALVGLVPRRAWMIWAPRATRPSASRRGRSHSSRGCRRRRSWFASRAGRTPGSPTRIPRPSPTPGRPSTT